MSESSPFDQVLCAIDGGEEALDAAYRGWRLAPGRPLTLVHVIDIWDAPVEEAERSDWIQDERRAAEVVLEKARAELLARGVDSPIVLEVHGGSRPDVFRDLTSDGKRHLLTMGSGEQAEVSSGPAMALPPPVTDRLTRRLLDVAGCSVLVNRLGTESKTWPRSIAVGVDGSPASACAYQAAVALARLSGGRVTAVMAVKHRPESPNWPAWVPDSVEVVEGEPADVALIRTDQDSDLIVVGWTGEHRSRGMGTTSEKVAAFSQVPVLVVHG